MARDPKITMATVRAAPVLSGGGELGANAQDKGDTEMTTTRLIVMEATAHVTQKMRQYGKYRHVAVVETDLPFGEPPKMISERALGVVRIVWDSGPCNVGGAKSAIARARAEAGAIVSMAVRSDESRR